MVNIFLEVIVLWHFEKPRCIKARNDNVITVSLMSPHFIMKILIRLLYLQVEIRKDGRYRSIEIPSLFLVQ